MDFGTGTAAREDRNPPGECDLTGGNGGDSGPAPPALPPQHRRRRRPSRPPRTLRGITRRRRPAAALTNDAITATWHHRPGEGRILSTSRAPRARPRPLGQQQLGAGSLRRSVYKHQDTAHCRVGAPKHKPQAVSKDVLQVRLVPRRARPRR